MKFDIKIEGVNEALKMFSADAVRRAVKTTLNEAGDKAKGEAIKQITEEYNVPPSTVREFLKVKKASYGETCEYTITARGRGIPLIKFGARQVGVKIKQALGRYTKRAKRFGNFQRGGQVTVMVKKAGGRKVVPWEPKPFIAVGPKVGPQVFARQGRERRKLRRLLGPGLALLFGSKKVLEHAKKVALDTWAKRFAHNLDFFSKK